MSLHRLESPSEDWASLDLLPVVKHVAILDRAFDLFLPTGDHIGLIHLDCLIELRFPVKDTL